MSKSWIENFSEKRTTFEVDYTFIKCVIDFGFISIFRRIRIVKYLGFETTLIHNISAGMNERYMFKNSTISKLVRYLYDILNRILPDTVTLCGENSIVESKYMKIKVVENVVMKHFKSFIRNSKLEKILS